MHDEIITHACKIEGLAKLIEAASEAQRDGDWPSVGTAAHMIQEMANDIYQLANGNWVKVGDAA